MKEGLRSGKLKVEKEKGCLKLTLEDELEFDDGVEKRKVNGEAAVVSRVLRSRVVVNGGGGGVGKKRRLVDNGDDKKGIAGRVTRSRSVLNGGVSSEVEDVGVVKKRKRQRVVKIVDDGLEKKEGDGKGLTAVRVLRSRTVVNGECDGDEAESGDDEAESDGVKAESDGVKAESDGVKAESDANRAESDGVKALSNANMAESDGGKAESGDSKLLNSCWVLPLLRSGIVVNGDCDNAETGGDKAGIDAGEAESDGGKAESNANRVENDGDNTESDGVKAESNAKMAESDGGKAESGDCKLLNSCQVLRSQIVVNGDCDKAESGSNKAESDGDKAENGNSKAESDGGKTESNASRAESDRDMGENNGDRADSDSDMGECENVEVAEFGKKISLVGNGGKIDGGGMEKKKVKETGVYGKAPVTGRLLRSRTAVNGECLKVESDAALVGESRREQGSHKEFSEVENEVEDQSVTGFTKNLKGKCGRPPKVKVEESGRPLKVKEEESGRPSDGLRKLKRKPGRPPKVKRKESGRPGDGVRKLKGKRGRPQVSEKEERGHLNGRLRKKLRSGQNGSEVLKGNPDKEGNVYFKRKSGLKSQARAKPSTVTNRLYLARKRIGKVLDVKTSSQAKRDKKGKDLDNEESEDGHKKQKSKSLLKKAVSYKIVKMILAAGWKIDRRQRNGKEYKDAVYVCPAGKTHWAVTKAYNALKMGFENGDLMACKEGFKFTPIPPEELSLLKRLTTKGIKKKKKKNKKKKGKGEDASEGIEGKTKKKLGNSPKGKRLLHENASTSTACEGKLRLAQCHKRQKTQNRKRCALLVRNSDNAHSENDGYIPYDGKRTVLAWMIDLGTLSLNSKLKYMNKRKRRVLLEGKILGDGIQCGCCDKTISLSEFVTHARIDYSEPLRYIFTDSGSSLLQCMLNSWNKQEESEPRGFHLVEVTGQDPNDDTCGICGDGGDLICCDGCPSTFHKSCLEIKKFPSGDWHCVYCSCKFCGLFDENTCQRDGSEDVAASALLICHLCEEKCNHQCCIQAKDAVNGDSSSPSFCTKNCKELFEKLERRLGVRHEVEEGFSLTLLRRFDVGDTPQKVDCNSKLIECNAKLAVAFLIMDECFLPMVDHRSGVNLIHNILYNRGSNFNRLNYGGFFTAILERGDEVICAATIRIHGNYLAEMPFIGTRYMYRRQGMCCRLLSAIESALCSLKVERLVIPAISELTETWTSVFGFKSLEESSKQKMKNMNVLVFPGVDILQKPLLNQLTETKESLVEGLSFADLEHHKTMKDVVCNTNDGCLAPSDGEATVSCVHNGNDELTVVESDTQLLCDVSRDIVESKSNTIPIPADSVCDALEPTEEGKEYQNFASVADVRALELVTKQNQPELLCDTAEGFLAGSDVEATASCKHKTTDELVAVRSDTELHSGVSHENREGGNKTMTVPTRLVSDGHEQTEATQLLCSVSEDNTLPIPTGSVSDAHELTEEGNEHQNSPVAVVKEVELGTRHNQHSMSKVERKSDLHSEVLYALGEGTENIDCKLRTGDGVFKPPGSHDEGFLCSCPENNATELQNVSLVSENFVHTDSEVTTQISHDGEDHKHHDSQHLQVEGSISRPDEKMLKNGELENNHSCIVTEEVHLESIKCSDSRIHTKTSKVARDEFHQASPLTSKKADDSKVHSTTLLFGCSITYTSGNGQDTHKVVPTPAENGSHPSCGVGIESSCNSKSPGVELTSCGTSSDSNGNSKACDVPGVDLTSGAHMNTKTLQQSGFDSDVDNNGLRQPNSSNTCASGGVNSFSASEVTILSNRGQAS